MKNYEINSFTLAIIPLDEKKSKVVEVNNDLIINRNSNEIIKESCKYFGSSYDGRMKGSKNLLGSLYKIPIIIEESKEIIFFPTKSARYNLSSWISLNNLENYYSSKEMSIVKFKNGQQLEFDIPIGSMENQILRASRLKIVLQNRKNI